MFERLWMLVVWRKKGGEPASRAKEGSQLRSARVQEGESGKVEAVRSEKLAFADLEGRIKSRKERRKKFESFRRSGNRSGELIRKEREEGG